MCSPRSADVDPGVAEHPQPRAGLVQRAIGPGQLHVALHPLGVRLSLDDFGAGYSGWSFLQQCPVDAIKIDRSMLEEGSEAARSRPGMVEAMVAFADRLGMPVTIEGVERAEQASAMRSLGISTAQGFFFARPLPADIVAPMLANGPLGPAA